MPDNNKGLEITDEQLAVVKEAAAAALDIAKDVTDDPRKQAAIIEVSMVALLKQHVKNKSDRLLREAEERYKAAAQFSGPNQVHMGAMRQGL